jgi:hypothetical protein
MITRPTRGCNNADKSLHGLALYALRHAQGKGIRQPFWQAFAMASLRLRVSNQVIADFQHHIQVADFDRMFF